LKSSAKAENQTFQVGRELYVRTFMQKTLIILKPDCMQQRHAGNVLNRFEQAGFAIVGCKMMQLTPAILREHYAHVADKPFYPEIEAFMSSQPVIVLALQGDQVVQKVRDLLGPTDSRKAAKGTIRGDFGTEMMKNVVHASDTVENAKVELARFFKPGEILAVNQTVERVH
jgi:nucleoside-diphosphate kinase